MSSPPTTDSRRNPWTHVLVACCTVFIVTVFLMVAAAFNPQAVALARFFDRHGMLILGVEVAAILALAVEEAGGKVEGLYDGSWAEWGSRGDCQAVTGPA